MESVSVEKYDSHIELFLQEVQEKHIEVVEITDSEVDWLESLINGKIRNRIH